MKDAKNFYPKSIPKSEIIVNFSNASNTMLDVIKGMKKYEKS